MCRLASSRSGTFGAREAPAMPARTAIQLWFRRVHEVRAALAHEQTEIERARIRTRGFARIEQVHTPGLKPGLARAREIHECPIDIRRNQAALDIVPPKLVARPPGVVVAV